MRFVEFWSINGTKYTVRVDSIIGVTCNEEEHEYTVILQFSKVSVTETVYNAIAELYHDTYIIKE